jgi:glucose-6-phosphate isomerase/transaldolase/glucose-6-phosphate isomerase
MGELCKREAPGNPGAILGAAMASLQMKGRDKLTFSVGRPVDRFGLWIEQLVAESTGKEGTGVLPVAGEALGTPADYGADRFFVRIDAEGKDNADARGKIGALGAAGHPTVHYELADALDLGAEMFRWEFATAVAGALLGIDAFDQPNVQEAKDRTNEILSGKSAAASPQSDPKDGAAARQLLDSIRPGDYFAITAYVPSTDANEAALDRTRLRVRDAKRVATTVGFGPRFLHSTGQFHKGGPNTGVFLQITSESPRPVPVPGKPWGFEKVVEAQAAGDRVSLVAHGRRVLSVRLGTDVARGLADLDATIATALASK